MEFSIQIFVENIIVSDIELQSMKFEMVSFDNKTRLDMDMYVEDGNRGG